MLVICYVNVMMPILYEDVILCVNILSAAGYQGYPQQGYVQQQPVYIKQKSKKGFLGSNAGKMAAGRWYFQSLPHQFSLMLDVQRQRGVSF